MRAEAPLRRSFNNRLSNNNDFFIDLNSLFLNSGFKIIIKKNQNVKINISYLISDENLTIFQRNYFFQNFKVII